MKNNSTIAPEYTCPVCKIISAKLERRILEESNKTYGEGGMPTVVKGNVYTDSDNWN